MIWLCWVTTQWAEKQLQIKSSYKSSFKNLKSLNLQTKVKFVILDSWIDFESIEESGIHRMCMIVDLYVCIYLCLPRFANRAPVRAETAYLEQQPTGLGRWSMENILKPLMGINTPSAFHKLTSLSRNCIPSRWLLPFIHGEMCAFDWIILFIHTYNSFISIWAPTVQIWQHEKHTVFNETVWRCR